MWSKLDDQFYLNPKNASMDRDEQDLYIAGNVYCSGQLTDGYIPNGVLMMLYTWAKIPFEANAQANAQAIAARLVEHGYWENAENGYIVHDFLDWNPSREEVIAIRNARSEAGKRGGKKSAARSQQKQALAQANAQAKSEQNSTPSPSPSLSEKEGAADAAEAQPHKAVEFHDPTWDIVHGLTPVEPSGGPKIDIEWVPADIQEMMLDFLKATKLPPPPDKSTRGYWVREMRNMRMLDNLTQDDLRRGIVKMRREGLTIKSPESVRSIALDVRAANQSTRYAEVYQ